MPTLAVHVGRSLRAAREKTGLTQHAAATAIGSSTASLGAWERGSATPTIHRAFALADLYGTTLDELVGYPKPPQGT
jgi:transcriptional regulator with XRE-family HTH domain